MPRFIGGGTGVPYIDFASGQREAGNYMAQGIQGLANSLTQNFGPMAQFRNDVMARIAAGQPVSPAELDLATGSKFTGPSAAGGIDPFTRGPIGAPPQRRQPMLPMGPEQLGGPPEPPGGLDLGSVLGGGGASPQMMAGLTEEEVGGLMRTPTPAAKEAMDLEMEDIRDRMHRLNAVNLQLRNILSLQGRGDLAAKIPTYNPKQLQIELPASPRQRARAARKYRQAMNDYIQSASQAVDALQSTFAVGPQEAAKVVPPEFLQYLRTFPNTTQDLLREIQQRREEE